MAKVDETISAGNAGWIFADIAESFESHIGRSVPHYDNWHDLICTLSDFFLPPGACLVYDLGTATGRLARKLLACHADRDELRLIGVDNVETMVDNAKRKGRDDPRGTYVCDDIATFQLEPCSLVTSYYTMQFVHPHFRQDVFDRIYQALNWGGAFILFEKVRGPDARFQDYMSQVYMDFKLENGFSEEEIIHKSRSLKGVQEPFSTQGNLDLLHRAGFVDVMTVAKWACFEGWLAIK